MKRGGQASPLRIGITVVVALVAAVPVVAVLVLLALQSSSIAAWTLRSLAPRFLPTGVELRLGRADGSWLRTLTLEDVALLRADGDTAIAVRRLHLRYRLWPLVHHSLALDSVRIEAPDIRLRRGRDSTWTLLGDRKAPDAAAASGPGSWTARIGVLRVDSGRIDAIVSDDSVYRVRNLAIDARDIAAGRTSHGRLIRADADLRWGAADAARGRFLAEGVRWDSARVSLDTLLVTTAASRIHGSGALSLVSTRPEATRLQFEASRLAFADLRPFLALAGPGSAEVRVSIDGTSTGYRLAGRLDTDDGGTVEASGRFDPGEGGLFAIAMEARIDAIDPSRLIANGGLAGRLSGGGAVDLKGTSVRDLTGSVRVGVDDSRIGAAAIPGVALDIRFENGAGSATLRADAAGLVVDGTGDLDLRGDSVRYAWRGSARWAADSLGSAAGRLSLQGVGAPPDGRLDIALDIDSATAGAVRVDRGSATLHLLGEDVDGRFALQVGDASVRGRLAGRPFADSPDWRVEGGRVDGLDLALLAPAAPSSDLNASFTASAVLASGRSDARFTLRLDSSSVGHETIGGGELRLRYAQDRAVLDGDVALGAGRARVTIEAWPAARPLRYAVRQARFEDVDVGALMGAATFSTRLSGQLEGSGDGLDPATLRSDLTLTLDSSRIDRAHVESAMLSLRSAEGRFRGDANVALAGGTIDVTGSLLWSDVPSWETSGTADLRSLGALLGDTTPGTLAARFDAGGSGLSLRTADAHARVSLESASWRTVHADSGRIELGVRNGAVRVDTLWARTNVASIEGGGLVPLDPPAANRADTADFHWVAQLENLQPVDAAFPSLALSAGDGRVELRVTGTADSLRLRGTAHVGALLVGTTRLADLNADANVAYSLAGGFRSGSLEVLLDRLAFPTATVTSARLTATLDSGDVRLHAEARVDARRTAELDARFVTADARPAVIVERAEFQVDQDRWTLLQPARIRYGAGVDIENFVLEAAGQRIALDAVWGDAGLTSLHAQIDSLRVETLADLAGFDRVRGTLSTRVDFDGAAGARTGDASLDFAMRSADGGGGDIRATARIAGDSAALDGSVTQDGRESLLVEGRVPLGTGSAAALDLRAHADSFRVSLLTPVLDPDLVRGLAGTLDGDVRITGTAMDPRLDGSLALADGRAHLTALGVTYRLDGGAELSGNAVHLADLRIRSGGGDLRLNGDVALESATVGQYDLAVRMDGFRAVDNDFVRATVSGDVKLAGTLTRPSVTGNVSIERGDLYLGSGLAAANVQDVTLTEADYAELEDYFGFPVRRSTQSTAPGFEALALDLSIQMGRDSWLRQGANPELAVQLTGQLSVRKDPGPDLQLLGELDAIPERSYVEQFGRRFQLSQGLLAFRGDPLNTQLDLNARYEVPSRSDNQPEATITLGLQGQVGDLRVTLGSEPAMDNADIVSYIATGRPASQSLSTSGGEGVAERAGGLALGQAASLIESFAAERVGLDVVEIRRQGLESATLIAGRYVSPSLYVGFQQPLGSSQGGADSGTSEQTRVEIELQTWRWLLLNFQSGGEALQFFLKARYGY